MLLHGLQPDRARLRNLSNLLECQPTDFDDVLSKGTDPPDSARSICSCARPSKASSRMLPLWDQV